MKRLNNLRIAITALLMFLFFTATAMAQGLVYYSNPAAADQGVTGTRTIKSLSDAIGSTKKATIVLAHSSSGTSTTYMIGTSITISRNITLKIEPGALTSIASAKTLTINGPFEAGRYNVLSGTGAVLFGASAINEAYPEWWGDNTTPGTTDMTAEINAALTANKVVSLQPAQTYAFSNKISMVSNNGVLRGNKAKLFCTKVIADDAIEISANHVLVDSVEIDGNNKLQEGIHISGANHVMIIDPIIHNIYHAKGRAYGIEGTTSTFVTIKGGEVYNISCGDTAVANRGIVFDGGSQTDILIDGVTVHDVASWNDGDLIKLGTSLGNTWTSMRGTIQNCFLYNFYKRAIKIQASDVIMKNNHIYDLARASNDRASISNNYQAIASFGNNVTIESNVIELDVSINAIGLNDPAHNTVIKGNIITLNSAYDMPTVRGSGAAGISIIHADKTIISNNIVNSVGTTIKIGVDGNNTTITDNQLTSNTYGISARAKFTGMLARGNSFYAHNGIVIGGTASGINIGGNSYFTTSSALILYATALITQNEDTEFYDSTVKERLATSQAVGNRILNKISGHTGTVVWNPGSLNDGAGETSADIAVTGATFGDYVVVAAPYNLQGITCTGYIQANEVVKIRLQNESGVVVDLASGRWTVKVLK